MQKILKLYLLREYSFSECAVILFRTLNVTLLSRFVAMCVVSFPLLYTVLPCSRETEYYSSLHSVDTASHLSDWWKSQISFQHQVATRSSACCRQQIDKNRISVFCRSNAKANSRLTLASEIKKNNNNIWLSNQVQKFPKISASCVKRRGKFKHKEI